MKSKYPYLIIFSILLIGIVFLIGCSKKDQGGEQTSVAKIGELNVEITPDKDVYGRTGYDFIVYLKIKNNENETLHLFGEPCDENYSSVDYYSVKDSRGKFLRIERGNHDTCLSMVWGSVLPGEEKVFHSWNLIYYDETEDKYIRVDPGEYTLVVNNAIVKDFGTTDIKELENKINSWSGPVYQLETRIEFAEPDRYPFPLEDEVLEEQLFKFLDAGCVQDMPNMLDCREATFANEFSCVKNRRRVGVSKEGEALGILLVGCPVNAGDLNEEEKQEYFWCGGGFLYSCASYLYWKDGAFHQVKNRSELAELVVPIDSESKALEFTVLAQAKQAQLEVDNQTFESSAVREGDTFKVIAYDLEPIFGCYSSQDVIQFEYMVTREGEITELSRDVVYMRKMVGMVICVD